MIGGFIGFIILWVVYSALTSMADKIGSKGRKKARSLGGIFFVILLITLIGASFILGTFDGYK